MNNPITAETLIELLSNVDPDTIVGTMTSAISTPSSITSVSFTSSDGMTENVIFPSSDEPGFILNFD